MREREDAEGWAQFHNLLGVRSLARRLDILRRQYLNHRFDRSSPIPPLPPPVLELIYDHEIVLPPRRLLMQPGTQTIDGLFFLVSLARTLRARTVFEIGTFIGLTAWTLARNLPDATVHTLDIPPDRDPAWTLEADDVHRGSSSAMVYRELSSEGDVRQHWEDSALFDFSPWSAAIDLVYIDGAHSEAYVRSDTENALRSMSPRAAIVWDDYWRLSPGVVKVLHSRDDVEMYRVPGTRLVVHFAPEARADLWGREG